MSNKTTPPPQGRRFVEELYRRECGPGVGIWRLGPGRRWFVNFGGMLRMTLDFSEEQLAWANEGEDEREWLTNVARTQLLRALFRVEFRADSTFSRDRDLTPGESRLLAMVLSSSEVHFEIAEDGTWAFLSPCWTVRTGHDLTVALGKSVEDYLHPEDLPHFQAFLKRLFQKQYPSSELTLRIRCESGEFHVFRMSGELRNSWSGTTLLAGGVLSDITSEHYARREAEADSAEEANPAGPLVEECSEAL